MKQLALAIGLALAFGGAALANTSAVTSAADKALCEKHGGTVEGSGSATFCATPAKDAECAQKNGAAYGFDYHTGGCGVRSSEDGATSGAWEDVQ